MVAASRVSGRVIARLRKIASAKLTTRPAIMKTTLKRVDVAIEPSTSARTVSASFSASATSSLRFLWMVTSMRASACGAGMLVAGAAPSSTRALSCQRPMSALITFSFSAATPLVASRSLSR